ncbi:MAG: hypothetical protein Q9168_003943 [Polycauliona sp. 1 TL-2023]
MAASNGPSEDDYILNRDWRAVARLHHRHMLFNIVRGYTLHPQVQLKPGAKIADIGGGTCIWAIDVVRDLDFPVTVDAIDISLAQCPPKSWLPDNIRLMTHDVNQPFPSSLLGTYDFPFRTKKMTNRAPSTLLEPGGLIQWTEQNPDANRIIVAPGVSTSTHGTEEVLRFLEKPRKTISFEWVSQLGHRLSTNARLVAFNRFESLTEHQQLWSIGVLQACEEFASNLERNGRSPEDAERVAALRSAADKAAGEMLNGVGIHSELVVAVAQKDSTSEPSEGNSKLS